MDDSSVVSRIFICIYSGVTGARSHFKNDLSKESKHLWTPRPGSGGSVGSERRPSGSIVKMPPSVLCVYALGDIINWMVCLASPKTFKYIPKT